MVPSVARVRHPNSEENRHAAPDNKQPRQPHPGFAVASGNRIVWTLKRLKLTCAAAGVRGSFAPSLFASAS